MKNLIKVLILVLGLSPVFSQNKLTKQQIDSLPNTIENQFLKTYSKAKRWHEYKMIVKTDFLNFQKSVLDSVTSLRKTITDKNTIINQQKTSVTELEGKITSLEENLNDAVAKEDSINFLGAPVSKTTYNSILWSIIGILTLGMAFFIYKFKSTVGTTKEAKRSLAETEDEFEKFRKKSIEKEQKLRRQLHDEVNKNRGV